VIDENTTYVELQPRGRMAEVSGPLSARFMYRRYLEDNRVIILWKSIIHDERYPIEDFVLQINQSGWYTIITI